MTYQNKNPQIVGATEGLVTNDLANNNITSEQRTILASINNDYEPLIKDVEQEPYPFDALPQTIMNAVEEVRSITQAPLSLIATSAINAMSLAIQGHVNVKRDNSLIGPVSIFGLTIADSGERKTTVDSFFTKEIREFELTQAQKNATSIIEYNNNLKTWTAKEKGLLTRIKKMAEKGLVTDQAEATLSDLRRNKPKQPITPKYMYTDATPEALGWNLANTWPCGGVIASEGGLFLGSHAMNNESVMRTLSLFNTMWDGCAFQSDRRKEDGSYTIHSARLTIGLQVQESTLSEFIARVGTLARGTGFFARFLFSKPASTQGTRFYSPPINGCLKLNIFNSIIRKILERPLPINFNQILSPDIIEITKDAKEIWISFFNEIEKSLGKDGELYNVRDLASKAADNMARLAALFQFFENIETQNFNDLTPISPNNMLNACRIISWHLSEAVSFFASKHSREEINNAIKLEKWLIYRAIKHGHQCFSRSFIQQNGPSCVRGKESLDAAISELIDRNRLKQIEGLREVYINEALLQEVKHAS